MQWTISFNTLLKEIVLKKRDCVKEIVLKIVLKEIVLKRLC